MSQNSPITVENQGFPSFRSDLNSSLTALASNNSGTAAPTTTYANQFWYDSTNDLLKMRNSDNDAWITLAYLNQTTDEWEVRSAVIQAVDSAGVSIKTDDGTTRIEVADDGDVSIDGTTLHVDATNNRIGVGTSSPGTPLDVAGGIRSTDSSGNPVFYLNNGTTQHALINDSNNFVFQNAGIEAMRIDNSRALLIGTTSQSAGAIGGRIFSNGRIVTNTNNDGHYFRRESIGTLIELAYGGTTVGTIGVRDADDLFINTAGGTGSIGVGSTEYYKWDGSKIYPENDNARDLGGSSRRWDDVYATNGTIQTSDRNEKQDIESLTSTEMNVAKRISTMFKKFRWIDSVEEKGDDARTHSGVIAQDVQQAFADEGLDAGDYALFISTTWWETQTDVPAVEAVAEVLDDDGNVVTEAVEAKDAYTRTDTYATQAEAPAGATERTRMGIRYPQLLSFLAAYNEQRFAAIESRLDALED